MIYPNKIVDIKSFWMPYLMYSMAAMGGGLMSPSVLTGNKLRMHLKHIRDLYKFPACLSLVSVGAHSMDC